MGGYMYGRVGVLDATLENLGDLMGWENGGHSL